MVPFDHIASSYDTDFTHSHTGRLQRKMVWSYLYLILPHLKGYEVLELNCGSGEDAVLFAKAGFNIVATDISQEMLAITNQKANKYAMDTQIKSRYLDLENMDETLFDKKFDLVFSDFGGLNCIPPSSWPQLLENISRLLRPGGRFIMVVMPTMCLWESLFFLLRADFKNIFRRKSLNGVMANLEGSTIKTWYYSPKQIKSWATPHFSVVTKRPIGITLPPSYLEHFFSRHLTGLKWLGRLESKLARFRILSGLSDHFLMDLKLK
jgi:ubiquinone/menaquinone biosynthesis C-methylase UbiE